MENSSLKVPEAPECPPCRKRMDKFDSRHLEWGTPFLWVCMNDECSFFVRGWKHMLENYGQLTSYRHMVTPDTGAVGALPAFSLEYLMKYGKPVNPYADPDAADREED